MFSLVGAANDPHAPFHLRSLARSLAWTEGRRTLESTGPGQAPFSPVQDLVSDSKALDMR